MKFLTKSQARDALIRLQTTDTSSAETKVAEVITTWKLKKIPVESFTTSQLKRVLIVICKERELVVSNFADLRWCSRCEQTLPTYKKSRFQIRHILMCIFAPGLGWAICMAQCCAGDMVYCTHCHQQYSDFHGKDGCCDCCDCSCCENCCC